MTLFITGGSRGIGRQVVLSALGRGIDVAFTYANDRGQADSLLAEAEAMAPDRRCRAYQLNVRHPDQVESVVDQVLEEFGEVSSVVCNAGITSNNLAVSMTDQEWQDVIDTNLTGTFYVVRKFLPAFLAAGEGRFVLISSIAKDGMAGQVNYSASKAGLIGLSGAIAKEYGRKSICSNVVAPGFFNTDMTRNQMSEDLKRFWVQHCPLRRMGKLEEVAEVILFLSSKQASFMTGQVISVTGGLDWSN